MTNIEKIRSLSADEMAEKIYIEKIENILSYICRKECETNTGDKYKCPYCAEDDCYNCIKRWLESEAE